jgi:PKD repeat protein
LFLTTNGGANWLYSNTLIGTSPITHIAVDPLNPQNVYCTIGRYVAGSKVYKSTDAGVTWTNISGTLPNLPVNCILYERGSNERLYIGTDAGVFYKEASMNDWVYYNTGLPNVVVTELEISYQDNKLWAATFGRGLWNSDLAGTPPPNAAFTANVTQICPGDCVNFIDNSSQTPTSWSWSFPGANTSSSNQQNPSNICYSSFGTYNVSLVATNSSGSGNVTQNGFIIVGSSPAVPQVQANPAPGFCQGNSAVLSVPNPCSGCSYSWSPGGQTGTNITVSSSGTHTVTATNGCGQSTSIPTVITAFPIPATPVISINGNMLFSTQASSYQWYLNGSPISGATQQMYVPTQSGNYTVEVTDVNNCISISGILFFAPTSRDADKLSESSNIVLFPNPAFDYIDLIIKDADLSDKFVVINILGEMMFEFQPTDLNAIHRLDVSNLPTGNYVLSYVGLKSVEFKKFSVIR